jgi:hypothetical protein
LNESPPKLATTEKGVENGTEEEAEQQENDDITDVESQSLNEARRRIKSCGGDGVCEDAAATADCISCLGNCHGGQLTRGSHVAEVVDKPVEEKKND